MKKVYARPAYCMNCHLCEVNCIVAHSRSHDVFRAYMRENLRGTARVIVEEKLPLSVAVQCRHCADPACVAGCISGAMIKDPVTGIVYCQEDKCVGCWTCVASCPFGAIRPGEKNGRPVPLKCDLCREEGEPACVAGCPNRALVFEERRAGA
ncbi:4Fe-4S ferredoxin [Moorella thermoacetica]|uniref:Iron-sulfur protein n=3 Tax=Neomoorella thermoacetica TaxID=1525 RepID=A0A1D7XAT0_NEOTH|nr:4Fe-4S dicluster domain-containing protein [Moorella thermoacetica]AKX94067.1 iron-sulfur protein [Moorella thermoacetica]AKX96706.1 iron-sulfur protein [Moorella thermoacetica]AOQ24018.1 Iron-sulfur protein [Moorella thermoacetica]OIQ12970.1 iron-sulfur protein [Moorella thermoacetica]OIQ57876.1 iron-sulfur protein [Moorella thermoacetica]